MIAPMRTKHSVVNDVSAARKHLTSILRSHSFPALMALATMFTIVGVTAITACRKDEESERPRQAKVTEERPQGLLAASDAESNAVRAIHNGSASRAIDQWGRAIAIYEGIKGKEADQARCISNRARALATVGRHEEAVRELVEAKALLESIGSKSRIYHDVRAVLHREQRLLEMVAETRTQKPEHSLGRHSDRSMIRPQTAIVARTLLNDYGFRRSFLMDKAEPTSVPEQLQAAMGLDKTELSALCLYGYKVHVNYHELLKKKYCDVYLGATFEVSPGFRAALVRAPEGATRIANELERQIGSQASIDE